MIKANSNHLSSTLLRINQQYQMHYRPENEWQVRSGIFWH